MNRSAPPDLLAQEVALRDAGRPYASAVVTRVRAPTSCRPGDRALVTDDGHLVGWVGGSCTEPVVVREALTALDDGRPRLLRLGPPDRLAADGFGDAAADEVVRVPLSCASEGEVEVLVEPHLPAPHVVVVGSAPVLDAFVDMARRVGYAAARVDTVDALADAGIGPGSHVVVATFGRYDEDAVAAALTADVQHVALVASAKRAATVLGTLRASGVDEAALGRVHAPAGLDLGSLRHLELAVALLGGVVAQEVAHRGRRIPEPRDRAATTSGELSDPVCGMTVRPEDAVAVLSHDGVSYGFCSAGCRTRFTADPAAFTGAATPGAVQ
ncbi:MAG: XdhC family protein [Actinomycetes bacterium]